MSPIDRAHPREVIWANVSEIFEAGRCVQGCSFVYAIGEENDGPLKIGKAKDPIKRLRSMQTGNPRRLRVEAAIVGDRYTENLLQEIWEAHAIRSIRQEAKADAPPGTEWFEADVREKLIPVLLTAAKGQAEFIHDCVSEQKDLPEEEMERIVREAHGAHDVPAFKRHETILLAKGAGYVTPRRSLI